MHKKTIGARKHPLVNTVVPKRVKLHEKDRIKTTFFRVFVSGLTLPGNFRKTKGEFKINLVGISHGEGWFAPTGRKTMKIVKQELSKEKGLIFAEQKDKCFIPKKYLRRTHAFESTNNAVSNYVVDKISFRGHFSVVAGAIKATWSHYLKELFYNPEKHQGLAPRLVLDKTTLKDPEIKKFIKSLGVTPLEFYKGVKLSINVRSVFFASQIIRDIQLSHKTVNSATVVVGAGHTQEMYKFLSNPKLAIRYIDKAIKELEQLPFAREIIHELYYARRIFSGKT